MSHQTGIKGEFCFDDKIFILSGNKKCPLSIFYSFPVANAELIKFFSKLKDGKVRVAKISIENGKSNEISRSRVYSTVSIVLKADAIFTHD